MPNGFGCVGNRGVISQSRNAFAGGQPVHVLCENAPAFFSITAMLTREIKPYGCRNTL